MNRVMIRRAVVIGAVLKALGTALFLLWLTSAARADSLNATPLPREAWPATVYYDVTASDCDKMGGKLGMARSSPLCYIASAKCEEHPGFKVVMRDAITIAGARIATCSKV